MTVSNGSNLNALIAFVSQRIQTPCSLVDNAGSGQELAQRIRDCLATNFDLTATEFLEDWLDSEAFQSHSAVGWPIDDQRSLVVANAASVCDADVSMVAVMHGPPKPTQCLLDSVLETYKLNREINSYQTALEESAIQLAQSFEEQNWLRGFARNATAFTKGSSANDMAQGILKPLGYLLRAQDVYLLVDSHETERSGLGSAKYGESDFGIDTIRNLLRDMRVGAGCPPVVRNNIEIKTPDGVIHSLIIVSIVGHSTSFGHMVGINRSIDRNSEGLPINDPEFGSGEVGLLEEAAVLLSTQAHNIHLLVKSNQLFLGSLHAMSNAIDARDPYTQGHSERVARLAFDLAGIIGLSNEACQEIYLAGILHDIGKIGIPDSVLLKNGALTDEEFRIIQQHPEIGYRIVERLGQLQFVLPGVLHHHERWDGKGYPHGLGGTEIPMMARVLAVADAFDAMTSSRPYRDAMPVEKACSIIYSGGDQQWDAEVVQAFKLWVQERCRELDTTQSAGSSLIPEGSPVEHIVQAVMALGL